MSSRSLGYQDNLRVTKINWGRALFMVFSSSFECQEVPSLCRQYRHSSRVPEMKWGKESWWTLSSRSSGYQDKLQVTKINWRRALFFSQVIRSQDLSSLCRRYRHGPWGFQINCKRETWWTMSDGPRVIKIHYGLPISSRSSGSPDELRKRVFGDTVVTVFGFPRWIENERIFFPPQLIREVLGFPR